MPLFGCGVSVMTLNQTGASSMTTIAAGKACAEFGDERASRTANLDRSRSGGNEYHFPDDCGNSGAAFGNWFLEQFEDYAKKYKKEHGRRPPVSTALGVTTVVTPDEEAVAQWDKALRDKFVKDAVEVLGLWYGRPLDGWAKHVDEGAIEERGLTREDELGNEGLHIHGAGRLEDTLPDEETLAKYLGAKGAKNYRARYRGKNDGRLYRTGTILNKGKLHLLHQMFAVEMAERGWCEPMDENDLEATGWSVKPHITGAEKREREKQGEVFPEAGRSANKYARMVKWERKQKEQQKAAEDARDAALTEERHSKDRKKNVEAETRSMRQERAEVGSEFSGALDELEGARSEIETMRIERDYLDGKLSELNMRVWSGEQKAKEIDAYVEVAENGYEPPAGAVLIPPEAMPEELRELLRYRYDDDEDATYAIDDELWPQDGEPDEDKMIAREEALEEALVAEHGADTCYVGPSGIWMVTLPEDYADEDGLTLEDMDDDEREEALQDYVNREVAGRVGIAERIGYDPTVPHPPLRERERALEAREARLDERSASIERELIAKKRELRDAKAELDGVRQDAARIRSAADADAASVRAAAERDAAGIRADARAKAYAEAKEEAGGLIERFLGSVVGRASSIAYHVLGYMRREMDLGPAFDAAAKTCMDVLNELSNEDVRDAQWGADPKTSNTNRIQRGVSRFFKQAFSTRADEILRDRTAAGATYEEPQRNERQFGD